MSAVDRKQPRDGFRQESPHVDGCRCVGDRKLRASVFVRTVRRDSAGTSRGYNRQWFVFECDDIQCSAVTLVREDVLAEFVGGAIGGGK